MSDMQLPPAAVVVTHSVANWDTWKKAFDEHESARKEASALGHHINRHEDDPNRLSIYVAVADADKAKKFTASEELADIMKEAGVTGPPELAWMTPVSENIIWDRELPAFMISHPVADFDTWYEHYQQADEIQRSNGIIGHAVNRSMDDDSMAVVYHQAESHDTLRAFLELPELRQRMEAAGVAGEPDVTFVTGGWAKLYD